VLLSSQAIAGGLKLFRVLRFGQESHGVEYWKTPSQEGTAAVATHGGVHIDNKKVKYKKSENKRHHGNLQGSLHEPTRPSWRIVLLPCQSHPIPRGVTYLQSSPRLVASKGTNEPTLGTSMTQVGRHTCGSRCCGDAPIVVVLGACDRDKVLCTSRKSSH
jgi:hypothetical protein